MSLAEAECRSARNVECEVLCRLRSETFASATALLEGLLECPWAESWGVRIECGLVIMSVLRK
jgi:hypothetical protein